MNLCRSCREDFGGVKAFDAHRVGKHAYSCREGMRFDPPVEDGRRCLNAEEMLEAGFVRNQRGQWSVSAHLTDAPTAFPFSESEAEAA